jgi:protein-S-isoprenylcysteine O-methyltransferase Ste14
MTGPRWHWRNVPLPEAHLAALGAATLGHLILPARAPLGRRTAGLLGWTMVAAGTGLAAWGVTSASTAGVEVDRPTRLVTTGAFAVSRNPMYEGWSIALGGLGMATRSPWIIAAAVFAAAATHRAILDEESRLSEAFGRKFVAYTGETPRYLASDAISGCRCRSRAGLRS